MYTRLRQKTYINALQTLSIVKIYYGKFQKEQAHCKICGSKFLVEREKMTDVNIATQMTVDFYDADSQFPDTVINSEGEIFRKPATWV